MRTIELTEFQCEAIREAGDCLPRFVAPRTGTEYVLVPVDEYELFAAELDEEGRLKKAWHDMSMKIARRMLEEP